MRTLILDYHGVKPLQRRLNMTSVAPADTRPPAPNVAKPPPNHRFPIVAIGSSAGGLEALTELLTAMPLDTGMALIVVTHQHPGHVSLLPELLGKITAIPVQAVTDGLKVEPNRIYVSPPGGVLSILGGVLHRLDAQKKESPHLPIDYFLRSLAADQKDRAICIILSGTGTDGTLGLRAIKGESGMVMVQQAESAKYAGMPSSAAATGLADFVLPAGDMPQQLVTYAHGPYLTSPQDEQIPADLAQPLQKIFVLLRSRTGHDFSAYKPNTIRRRIERRMNLHQIDGPAQYVRYLQENPHELDILFQELLISVTNFFRDPAAFEALATTALPALIESRPFDHTFRIWVPGCATGEEVYSLAILLREGLEVAKRPCNVQIFGTDLDNQAIETARNGRYPEGIAHDISPQRLERYFTHNDNGYRIHTEVRELTVFALQNVIKDPPFIKLDLISCRNLLIYLNSDLQHRLLPIFHYALKPGGLLFLGSSESIGNLGDLFEVVDKKWKIYRRKEAVLAPLSLMDFMPKATAEEMPSRVRTLAQPVRESNIGTIVDRLLLARFVPASVVVNDRGDVVYIHGRTGAFLEPSPGQPRLNILDMAREGLPLELASALRQASEQDTEVVREGVQIRTHHDANDTNTTGITHIKLCVLKLKEPENVRGLLLVSFRPCLTPLASNPHKGVPRSKREVTLVAELEHALQNTKESLQSSIEELQTANEELKSTNEELQSTNEELQSTNEEMETSKEEMQSLNEELSTVNAEMQSKVEDMSRTNDDMQNLLNSTEVATIFLDGKLNIKRYTEQARVLISLIPTDIGRPLAHLASSLAYSTLVEDCREVLRTLVFKLAEVHTKDGHWYLMRIMPYRTAENVIDGVVITLVDINPVKLVEKSLLRMSKVFLNGPEPILLLDLKGVILALNDEAETAFGWSRQEMIGKSYQMICAESSQAIADNALQKCLTDVVVRDMACAFVTKAGRELAGKITLKMLTDDVPQSDAICFLVKLAPP